ncbi:hypothetical protein Tco_0919485 [Tanacetum coccineum]
MDKLDLRNTQNSLKHNTFKITVMFKQPISFFMVFHPMSFQVNTKFLNALPPEWSKFVTNQGEDLIDCINKAMTFLSVVASRFPPSNNQLRTSSNPRNQAIIQDGRVTIQQIHGRRTQSFAGEGHMARQCTQPKRPRNTAWFKEKLMLAEPQEASQILDEEQLAFLADPEIDKALVAQQTIPQNSVVTPPKWVAVK